MKTTFITQVQFKSMRSVAPSSKMASLKFFIQFTFGVIMTCLVSGLFNDAPLPKIDLDEWWGPKEMKYYQDTRIRPFRVDFNESLISDLRHRLHYHRPFTPPLEGIAFEYGFNSKQLQHWVDYWTNEYPFEEREHFLNQFPQYKTNIQGLDIHFIRVTSKDAAYKETVPLLMLHGWPGSVREFYETIPLLLDGCKDRKFALEIIVPSLPGFGFSDAAVRPGLGVDKAAVIFRNLMHRLGHKRFYIQGGDLGAIITSNMATFFPQEVLGYHTNMVTTQTPYIRMLITMGSLLPEAIAKPDVVDRIYPLLTHIANLMEESGYLHIQATKPDTVGVGVSDSPAGLAAYILEKFSTGTRLAHRNLPDGGLTAFFTPNQLIDNLMIYWTSNCMLTAMRMYAETFNKRYYGLRINEIKSLVPMSVIQAKNEITYLPPWMIKKKFPNLLKETVLPDGGHFLALEKPVVFAEDVLYAIDAFILWHESHQPSKLSLHKIYIS